MSAKSLDHLNMNVTNLGDSLDWYGRLFGFEKVEGGLWRGTPWAIIRSGDALLCLYEGSTQQGGVNHFGIRIEDPTAWTQTLEREEEPVLYGGAVQWPHSTSWYVEDPNGYEIEVVHWNDDTIHFPPRASI